MSTIPDLEEKPGIVHIDNVNADKDDGDLKAQVSIAIPPRSLSFIQTCKAYPKASFLCIIAALSAISDGYQISMSGSVIALPGFIQQFGFPIGVQGAMKLDPNHVALFGTMKTVFTGLGAAMGTWPCDKWGRKPMILAIQIILACGTLCEMFATHWSHWVGARAIEGFGNGLNISITNVYIAELAPTAGRGALIALYAVWYTIGGFLCSLTLYVVQALPASQWRNSIYSSWAFTGAACLLWLLLPESPRFYCQVGRAEDSKRVLRRLFGGSPNFDVEAEYATLEREVMNQKQIGATRSAGSYRDLLKQPNLRRLCISALPYLWQITLGVPIVLSYSAYFFQLAGLQNPFIGTLGVSIVQIVATAFAALWLLERIGRRIPLLTGGIICISCVISVGGTLRASGSAVGPALVFLACVWAASFSMSNNPLVYTYVSETATVTMRAKTSGVALLVTYCFQIGWMYATPVMLNSPTIGLSNSAFIYAAAGFIGLILMYFFVPELKGRSFEEMDELFDRKIDARNFHKTETQIDLARNERSRAGQV